jgi:hypothetical protein
MENTFLVFSSIRVTVIYSVRLGMNLRRNTAVTNGKELSHTINKICLCAELFNGLLENINRSRNVGKELKTMRGPTIQQQCRQGPLVWHSFLLILILIIRTLSDMRCATFRSTFVKWKPL